MKTIGLSQKDIENIKAVFAAHPEIEKAVLYGSRAKGSYKTSSDIDLTFFGKDLDLNIVQEVENELDDLLLPYRFDISIFHQIDNSALIDHIERVGIVFWEK
jgi:predicted nucleotidyltransferase